MYIVRDKSTKKVLHVNPAPLSQELEGAGVYYQFDPRTMEVGKGELPDPPEYFHIDERGFIVPWTLQEQFDAGVLKLAPHQKFLNGSIAEKSLAEKVAEGIITIKPTEKVVDDRIEEKSVAEKVADGLIKLEPTEVLDGEDIREMTDGEKAAKGLIKLDQHQKLVGTHIVPKSDVDLAREGLLELAPDEKIEGNAIIKLTPRQMLDEGRYNLGQYKAAVLERHAQACLEARRKVLPDYELLYAAIGAVSSERLEEYRTTVAAFIEALDRVKAAVHNAKTADTVDAVPAYYAMNESLHVPGMTS